MKPDDSQKQFLLQEYSQIREEIMWYIKQITETERYAIAISGLVWAWLVTQQWNLALIIAVAIPVLATKLLHYKRKGLSAAIWSRAEYIYKIEDTFLLQNKAGDLLGWEHRERKAPLGSWNQTYWSLLFWGNILIAVIYLLTQLIQGGIFRF